MPADEDTPASADPAPAARDLAAEAKVGKFEVRLEAPVSARWARRVSRCHRRAVPCVSRKGGTLRGRALLSARYHRLQLLRPPTRDHRLHANRRFAVRRHRARCYRPDRPSSHFRTTPQALVVDGGHLCQEHRNNVRNLSNPRRRRTIRRASDRYQISSRQLLRCCLDVAVATPSTMPTSRRQAARQPDSRWLRPRSHVIAWARLTTKKCRPT